MDIKDTCLCCVHFNLSLGWSWREHESYRSCNCGKGHWTIHTVSDAEHALRLIIQRPNCPDHQSKRPANQVHNSAPPKGR